MTTPERHRTRLRALRYSGFSAAAWVMWVLGVPLRAVAQGTPSSGGGAPAAVPVVPSYAVPEAPAFTFLGLNPSKVTRPIGPRDIAIAVLQAVDSSGKMQQGFALSLTPWYFLPGFSVPLERYQRSWPAYVAANAQLSLGTARGTGDSAATDLAVGLRFTLLDGSDPMRDTAFTHALRHAFDRCKPNTPDATAEAGQTCLDEAARRLRKQRLDSLWNATGVALGWAAGWRFADSRLSQGHWRGWSAWLASSLRLGFRAEALAQAQLDRREPLSLSPAYTALLYGTRALYGSATLDGFLEVVGTRRFNTPVGVDRGTGQWSGGVEFLAAENLWLSAGFGSAFAQSASANRVVLIANIRWGVSASARGISQPLHTGG